MGKSTKKQKTANGEKYYGGTAPRSAQDRLVDEAGQALEVAPKGAEVKVEWVRGEDMATLHGVLRADECATVVQAAEKLGFSVQTSRGPKYGEAEREHGRLALEDDKLARTLWDSAVAPALEGVEVQGKRAVGLNPNIRLYKYVPGNVFGKHYDQSMVVRGQRTEYTLLLYLSGDLQGGQTIFYDDREREIVAIQPTAGMALIHRHGDKCRLHEAAPVIKGTKYVLRSDVVFG